MVILLRSSRVLDKIFRPGQATAESMYAPTMLEMVTLLWLSANIQYCINNIGPSMWPKPYHNTAPQGTFLRHLVHPKDHPGYNSSLLGGRSDAQSRRKGMIWGTLPWTVRCPRMETLQLLRDIDPLSLPSVE